MLWERRKRENVKMKRYDTSKEALISAETFSFAYESIDAPLLIDLDFTLHRDEVTLLMGASGSGKSTVSLCLNGLYPGAVEGETSGRITFSGKDIATFPSGVLNQHIGIVFQDPETQFCMIHVEDELAFTLENLRTPPAQMDSMITDVLKLVDMETYKSSKFHELSGGEKQKIALASVLLSEPELLILDEATVNLDPASTREFVQLIQAVQKEQKISVLIIDHQADEWLEWTDRVLLLGKEGRLVADEHPERFFTKQKALLNEEGVFLPKKYADSPLSFGSPNIATGERILTVESVTFNRKNKSILNGVDLEIREGEFISIVGRNGSGKSTLLEIMAGILEPAGGQVTMHGKSLQHWPESNLRQKMGFVFQNPEHQFITDTVYDEIVFGMKLNDYPEEVIRKSSSFLLEQFQLSGRQLQNPFSLSGGQKRRLSVATALDDTPDILLFDEPTFGQDAYTTHRLMEMIFDLIERGIAIVFVTHDMDLAALSDHIFVLHDGTIAFSGQPDDLWEQGDLLKKARLCLPYHIEHHVPREAAYR